MMVMPFAIAKNVVQRSRRNTEELPETILNDTRYATALAARSASTPDFGLADLNQLRHRSFGVADVCNGRLKHVESLVHLLVGDHEWHEHADHVGI